jgi:hypothetical protein
MLESNRVADMTVDELQTLIGRMIEARLPNQTQYVVKSTSEAWQAILENIIEPAPGQPTALELLQEERNKWYKST